MVFFLDCAYFFSPFSHGVWICMDIICPLPPLSDPDSVHDTEQLTMTMTTPLRETKMIRSLPLPLNPIFFEISSK